MISYLIYTVKWCIYRIRGNITTPYSPLQLNLHEEEGFYTYPKYLKTMTFRRKWMSVAYLGEVPAVLHLSDYPDKRFKIRFNQ